jgi:hypothetical protein
LGNDLIARFADDFALASDVRKRRDGAVNVAGFVSGGELDADAASPLGTTRKKKPMT